MNPIVILQNKILNAKKNGYSEIKLSVDFLETIINYFIDKMTGYIDNDHKNDDVVVIKTGGNFKK